MRCVYVNEYIYMYIVYIEREICTMSYTHIHIHVHVYMNTYTDMMCIELYKAFGLSAIATLTCKSWD